LLHLLACPVCEVLVSIQCDLIELVASHVVAVELAGLAELLGHVIEHDGVVLANHLEFEVAPLGADIHGTQAIVHQELTSAGTIAKEVVKDMEIECEVHKTVTAFEVVEAICDLSAVEAIKGSDRALVDEKHLFVVVFCINLVVKTDLDLRDTSMDRAPVAVGIVPT